MSNKHLNYRGKEINPRRDLRSALLIGFGVPMILYGLVGSVFVEAAFENGDPSVSKLGVYFLLGIAFSGTTMVIVGTSYFMRKAGANKKRTEEEHGEITK